MISVGSSFMAGSFLIVAYGCVVVLSVCEALRGIGFVWIVLLLSFFLAVVLQLLSHIMLHALGLSTGVVVAVAFEQVDRAPDCEAGTEGDDEGLEDINCAVKEIHNIVAGIYLKIVK